MGSLGEPERRTRPKAGKRKLLDKARMFDDLSDQLERLKASSGPRSNTRSG